MATQTRVVQAGDTVSKIAQEFGVPTSAVTGFRSNDPNTIFPGETLSIQVPDVPQDTANTSGTQTPEIQTALPQNAPAGGVQTTTPQTTSPTFATPQEPTQSPTDPNITQDGTALVPGAAGTAFDAPTPSGLTRQTTSEPQPDETTEQVLQRIANADPEAADRAMDALGFGTITPPVGENTAAGFTLPSGITIPGVDVDDQGNLVDTDTGEIVTSPIEDKAQTFFNEFGLDAGAIGQGFSTNPFGTLQSIIENIMQLTGLPDTRAQITDIANEIESIENERDEKIAQIQDNPFFSAGSKNERIQKLKTEYDNKLNARINKLTLLQNAQQDARQQAQFVATTAINLYNQERAFQFDQIEAALDRAEKQLEAEAVLDEPLSVAEAKQLGVPFGTTRRQAFGITPVSSGTISDLSPAQQNTAFKLADDFEAASKDFFKVRDAYNRVLASAEDPSAAGDLALIFNFMKTLDPGSVVRESEFATAENAGSIPQRIRATYNKVLQGQRLSAGQRADFVKRSQTLFDTAQRQQQEVTNAYSNRAELLGIPSQFVVRDNSAVGVGIPTQTVPTVSFDDAAAEYEELSGSGQLSAPNPVFEAVKSKFGIGPFNFSDLFK